MLKKIELEKYKCYKEQSEFEIRPLTVLCGVNSSGKSSVIKSLLLLMQSYENSAATNEVTFNGKFCNCGTFDDVVFEGQGPKFSIENEFVIVNSMDATGNAFNHRDIVPFKELNKMYRNVCDFDIYSFELKIKVDVVKYEDASNIYIEGNKIKRYEICLNARGKSDLDRDTVTSSIILDRTGNSNNKYNMKITNIPSLEGKILREGYVSNCICYFSGMRLNNLYRTKMDIKIRNILANILTIFRIVSAQYEGMKFIAPLRENPKRYYISDKNVNDVGVSGEDSVLLFSKVGNKTAKGSILPPDKDDRIGKVSSHEKIAGIMQRWLDYFELGKIEINGNEIIRLNISGHNIVDVGFGVSQVLPIILQGLVMQQDETLILEQPEIHLHPKMQMKMADYLLSLALAGKNTLVETHSDHIVNRICRRVMENPELNKMVNIYFVDKDEAGNAKIELVEINSIDGLKIENENFFYQFASETEKIIDVGYRNLVSMRTANE